MSKYKVGDKVVYEVKEITRDGVYLLSGWKESEPLSTYTEPLEAKIRRQAAEITRLLEENMRLKPNYENIRAKGQNEAWELARKIILNNGYSVHDLYEIFGYADSQTLMKNHTYQEAAEKVAEWEKAKEKIKRGDIIRNKYNTSSKFCVTDIGCDGHLYGVGRYGLIYSNQDPEYWEKTGRHIDIDSFLKQIGGEQE